MSEISAKSDASSHQNQTQDSLQRDPGEIEQRPHAVAIQLHKGILEREIMTKRISELQLLFFGERGQWGKGGNFFTRRGHPTILLAQEGHINLLE